MTTSEKQIADLFAEGRERGVFSRAALTVVDSQGVLVRGACGELNGTPISTATRFDVASVTKAVPVSTLMLRLIDSGELSLDTPVRSILPELNLISAKEPTLFHLLTQTLDFGYSLAGLKELPPQLLRQRILTAELRSSPGEKFSYCNATSLILGMVIEKVKGDTLDGIANRELFAPLGMNNTGFRPDESTRSAIVPTEICSWRNRTIQGEIHDESAWVLNQIMIPGAAGLFSTTDDLAAYLTMILRGGSPLFSAGFIDQCAQNQLPASSPDTTGLGFELNQPYMGTLRSDRTIGKTGFTGSVIVADLQKKKGFALLTDYTWPKRKADKEGIMEMRSRFADLVWQM